MTQMFRLESHLPLTQASILATHMFGIKFQEFSIIKLEEERTVSTPSDEITEQGQTPETWRPPIHARVRIIQSALRIFR